MKYETIRYDVAHRILTITLDRPTQLNAFTVQMANELVHAFQMANDDPEVKAIVVTGAGRAFCAGMDLSTEGNVFGLDESLRPTLNDIRMRPETPEIRDGVRDTGGRVTLAMYTCSKPIIGAINGPAVGIGATMTCAMDIRLASKKAKVGFVFNKLGIVPEACSSWFLPRIVGLSVALEWCYTAEIIDAERLLDARFVKSVHPPNDLMKAAYALAQRMVEHSTVAMALTRQMMYRNSSESHPMKAHEIDSLAMFYTSIGSGKEGVRAFLEKRSPNFEDSLENDLPPFYPWW